MAVEQIVHVEVERIIEQPQFIEKVVEVHKNVDAVIEQRYDVIRENVIEVQVEKEIRIPVKVKRAGPVIRQLVHETDVYVDSNVVVPVQGAETESHQEVMDPDLENRTRNSRANLSTIQSENNALRSELTTIEGKSQIHEIR